MADAPGHIHLRIHLFIILEIFISIPSSKSLFTHSSICHTRHTLGHQFNRIKILFISIILLCNILSLFIHLFNYSSNFIHSFNRLKIFISTMYTLFIHQSIQYTLDIHFHNHLILFIYFLNFEYLIQWSIFLQTQYIHSNLLLIN